MTKIGWTMDALKEARDTLRELKEILCENERLKKENEQLKLENEILKKKGQQTPEYCPRCIEDWINDEDECVKGEKKPSHCTGCGVCEDCECLEGCGVCEDWIVNA